MRYEQAWIVGIRHGPLRVLIDDFKFQNKRATGVDLAQLLYARLPTLPKNTVLVPIPTTPAHIRERGYDHIGLITRSLSLISGFPIQRVLERGNTATQHFASRSKRLVQAQSAFRITSRLDPTLPYLIIDDVITTGSTIDHASRLLYNAGARQIWIGALARQPLD
ncbi:MAG: hypothetical protein ABIP50_00675 [Candidatus Saccharimonadales bacterium]